MTKMTDLELQDIVMREKNSAMDALSNRIEVDTKYEEYYEGELFGDEVEGQSQIVSTDVYDLVESDMASLVRTLLGHRDIMKFEATTSREQDRTEADEKTQYINWIVRNQPNSFRIIYDWLKSAEKNSTGIVKFYYDEKKETKHLEYEGLDSDELMILIQDLDEEYGEDIEIIEQEQKGDKFDIEFKCTKSVKKFVIENVPSENFIISRNARSEDDATLVGDVSYISRGELVAMGYDRDLIASIPKGQYIYDGSMREIRFMSEGGYADQLSAGWATEMVTYADLYVMVDYDGDGIAERRNIVMAGNEILENEQHDLVPYAIMSGIPTPHSAIGKPRAHAAMYYQRTKSEVVRQTLNNMYRVNNARIVTNDKETNMDDLLVNRPNGVIRTKGVPANAVYPLVTEYVGDKSLQVVQYLDAARAQSTGNLMANQSLSSDSLHKETATRFEGVRDASMAKIELVARVYAETGFRKLYEGLAWLVSRYQDDKKEIIAIGKPVTVNPKLWRYDHKVSVTVGLGANDDDANLANMSGLFQIQSALKERGSSVIDDKKIYNTINRLLSSMGVRHTNDYINDPEIPEQQLQAENEQLKAMLQQAQQMLQQANPLAEQEKIRQEGKLMETQMKIQSDMQKFMLDMQSKIDQFDRTLTFKLTELEAKTGKNIPDSTI